MMSLFMCISNGIDWNELWRNGISKMRIPYQIVFILWMVFMLFAILNIISGMFIERAFRVINSDRDFWIIEEAKEHRMYKDRLLGLFAELDIDEDRGLTWTEFKRHFENHHVK